MPISRLDMGTMEEITRPAVFRSAIAEFFSTLLFVFASQGSSISFRKLTGGGRTPIGLLISAASNSFALTAAVAASANTSGGHVNPAITFALFLGGHITLVRAILYIAAQLLGSIAAAFLLDVAIGADPAVAVMPSPPISNAVVMEGLKTFGLVITVCAVVPEGKLGGGGVDLAPLAIGFAVGANVLVGGSFDGAVMNPAATFGPAVVGWVWDGLWVCWAGQFVGGGFAGILYEFFFGNSLRLQNYDY